MMGQLVNSYISILDLMFAPALRMRLPQSASIRIRVLDLWRLRERSFHFQSKHCSQIMVQNFQNGSQNELLHVAWRTGTRERELPMTTRILNDSTELYRKNAFQKFQDHSRHGKKKFLYICVTTISSVRIWELIIKHPLKWSEGID